MIKASEIISPEGDIIGIEIEINEKIFFISKDQEKWPGIRCNKHPRFMDDNKNLVEFKKNNISCF